MPKSLTNAAKGIIVEVQATYLPPKFMDITYSFAFSQTHNAVERYTADSFLKLRCKPGYVQRGAVCQPDRSLKSVGMGALRGAIAGAGVGVLGAGADLALRNRQRQLREMYSITGDPQEAETREGNERLFNNLRLAGEVARGVGASVAGGYAAGGTRGRRLAGAASGFLASEVIQALADRYGRDRDGDDEESMVETPRRRSAPAATAEEFSTNPLRERGGALALREGRRRPALREGRRRPALAGRTPRLLPPA